MDWMRAVDGYCERTSAALWAEPVNALSNIGFLVAAWLCWRMVHRVRDEGARLLAGVLAVIGIGSFLFHTVAEAWAGVADVVPIVLFILIYLYLATVRLFGAPVWAGLVAAGVYVPVSAGLARGIGMVTGPMNGSIGYVPVVVVIAAYALGAGGPGAGERAGAGDRRDDPVDFASFPLGRFAGLRGFSGGNAFRLASPERGDAGVDDRRGGAAWGAGNGRKGERDQRLTAFSAI